MSEAKPAEKPAEEKKDAPKKKKDSAKASGPSLSSRITGMFNAAGCASCLTAVFLTLLVICVWTIFWLEPGNIPWRHAMSWTRIVLVVLLVIAIPLVLYKAIRLWLEGDESAFPDIDFAWNSGIDALRQNGLVPTGAPLFLLLGSAGVRQEVALVRAAALSLRVHDVPEGPAPLHWYAGPDGIYLSLTESCGLSSLAALLEKRHAAGQAVLEAVIPSEAPALAAPAGETGSAPAAKPAAPAASSALRAASPPPGGGTRGTVMLDQFVAEQEAAQAQAAQAVTTETASGFEPVRAGAITTVIDQPAILSQKESARQRARLAYVCRLLRMSRFPLCPTNGILMLLPFELLQATQRETQQLQKTMRSDLAVLQRELATRCPVTALVIGMHQERGFRELVRRVGRERASAQRFGRRFDVRTIPSAEALGALCALAVGVFEDWIHTLFREAEALSRPGNLRLYGLLCTIRSTLSGVLSEVLVGSLAHDPQRRDLPEPVAFSGCYFAATGESDDQQAFVRGVFDKLIEEQEEVEWTRDTVAGDRESWGCGIIMAATAAVCILVSVGIAIWRMG